MGCPAVPDRAPVLKPSSCRRYVSRRPPGEGRNQPNTPQIFAMTCGARSSRRMARLFPRETLPTGHISDVTHLIITPLMSFGVWRKLEETFTERLVPTALVRSVEPSHDVGPWHPRTFQDNDTRFQPLCGKIFRQPL